MNIVSLFSGAGGFDLGFKKVGFKTIFATDNWETACKTLKINNISEEVLCEDIRKIDFIDLKRKYNDISILIGGPPCPPYSVTRHYLMGKEKGFSDEKSGYAVPEYFRALSILKPKIFVFENVDGFMYKTHKEALEYLENKSVELGYKIAYKVLNSANYGVPQTRKRFICVGVLNKYDKFKFPEETHSNSNKDNLKDWVTAGDVLSDLDTDLTDEEIKQKPGTKDNHLLKEIPPGDNYLYFTEKRGHLNPLFKWKSRYWTFLLKLTPERPSWTIQASFSTNQGPFHWRNRFLRIDELKRLQSFDDSYKLEGTFKDMWRQIGNAVPPKLSYELAKKIKKDYFNGDN